MTRTATESGLDWSEYLNPAWLARRREAAIDPGRPMVDPHHHLWEHLGYGLHPFLDDLGAGHNVRATVHLECSLARDPADPPHLRAVGETRYLMGLRDDPRLQAPGAPDVCAGIVGHIELAGPEGEVEEAIAAHVAAGQGHFKGVRFNAFYHPDFSWQETARPGLTEVPEIRRSLAQLARHGLICDVMAFDYQLPEVAALARALPQQTFVVNHYGGFLGRIHKQGDHAQGMAQWRAQIAALAGEPNVVMKLGGLTCDFFSGIQLHLAPEPPDSDTIAAVYRPFFEPCIAAFGTERCMFESNYPADREQVDYTILWNGFKKLARDLSEDEQTDLFSATAARVYSLTI